MTADQSARDWLLGQIDFERLRGPRKYRFTLDRMHNLIDAAGLGVVTRPGESFTGPIDRPVIIHVAGTKGKGSVSTMVAAMTTAAGHRTGLYTSPHLHRLEERIQIDGLPVNPTKLTRLIEWVRPIAQSLPQPPSFFELTTTIAWEAFRRANCRVWVIETGLGGRLDSTNVIASDIAAITHIGLDHQAILGRTVKKIAREKAGIIKPERPVVVGAVDPAATGVIEARAAEINSPVIQVGRDFEAVGSPVPVWGNRFHVSGLSPWLAPETVVQIDVEGRHQMTNAAVALAVVQRLPVARNLEACLAGLRGVSLPARQQRFDRRGRTILLDAAHNPDSIAALLETVRRRFSDVPVGIVFATSIDKDADAMLRQLAPMADRLVLTEYLGNPRRRTVADLWQCYRAIEPPPACEVDVVDDPVAAAKLVDDQLPQGGVVVICGSFFLAAELAGWAMERNPE